MLLARQHAEGFAHPPISNFFVGAVAHEAETGNLVFGGNLEFPRAHIGNTVHGEGFVATRAFSRGTSLDIIAIGEAHPCAHCRQYLSEFAATQRLLLIDPLGHRLKMAELYPWPFDPAYLGETGALPGAIGYPDLALRPNDVSDAVAQRLLDLGRRCHTPYGKAPAAIVLELRDGAIIGGSAIESVAFNPTISPLQAAMIDLYAHGYGHADIAGATMAAVEGAAVDYVAHAHDLLSAITPTASFREVAWEM
jgi:cytidine deaminase